MSDPASEPTRASASPAAEEPAAARGRRRRHDPGRRERIVRACLDVIAEHGVAGTSHRRVAAAADVPLGSMTYHFTGMGDLLHAAFAHFAGSVVERFEHRMAAAPNAEEAKRAVVAIITDDVFDTRRGLVLTHELYTLAARDPAYRDLTNGWMRSSRAALERHFDPTTARLIDALIEGLTIHRALDTEPQDRAVVLAAVERLARP
ncbi:TetR/AcrR family transcriptional regulator [Streptomonospora litoralis]|uniref:Transcriptional regulator BetI n=1 Tax=Streptomonospora litoralis TaxID=2498135 RepID=A0A4P6QAH4_9ACTN|nr:TetR family transcriptional regulator [Streptomonospora litoralis]QBI56257.1 transcriptional regulator BetI [Streptomonospora litoralis]